MHHFEFKKDNLYAEGVSIKKIAGEVGTPVYIYSKKTLTRHFNAYSDAFASVPHLICYSVKANSNLTVLNTIAKEGGGFDIVSQGELYRVIKAGGDTKKVVFSGVGKTEEEIEYALKKKILMFNVESPQELALINKVAKRLKKKAPVAIRINPNVDPKTHPYISTGLKKNKFGIEMGDALKEYINGAKKLKNVDFKGVDCHIGSQITEITPFIDALKKVISFIRDLRKAGIEVGYLDMGGGLGIPYDPKDNVTPPHPSVYAEAVIKETKGLDLTLLFEPGRSIAGNAGILVTKVTYTKKGSMKNFVIVDAAMNDLARPSLYGSYHDIQPVKKEKNGFAVCDIVGPICETGDFLAQDRKLQKFKEGDLVAVMSAGAYGFTMASNYNTRPRSAEVMVDGNKYKVIRKREKLSQLLEGETVPPKIKKRK